MLLKGSGCGPANPGGHLGVSQGAATPVRCSSLLSMVTSYQIPKIPTAGKSSIEEMGNSPGWTQGSFGKVRDVSWLVWGNHELQAWLNWHWGRDGSV